MNAKKRKSKQVKKNFLALYAQYVIPYREPMKSLQRDNIHIMLHGLTNCGDITTAIENYVTHCPLFHDWCNYIQCSELKFSLYGKALGVSWFHSIESLGFVCDSLLHMMLEVTGASSVCCMDVVFGLTEACMRARGVPVLCQSSPSISSTDPERFTFLELYSQLPPNTDFSVIYIDMRLGIQSTTLESCVSQASFVVFAGPMCMLPFLYRLNSILIQTHKFHRRIYKTYGVSSDRVPFDDDVACTCSVVYYRSDMTRHLPYHSILDNPTSVMRQHYIRHALTGNIPEYWKLVLTHIPLKIFLKALPSEKTACPFDYMLIDVFSNGHEEEDGEQDEEEELELLHSLKTCKKKADSQQIATYCKFDKILGESGIIL